MTRYPEEEEIAARLYALIAEAHPRISHREVGARCGCSRKTIYNYANGYTRIPLSRAVAICELFGVTVYWLATGEAIEEPVKSATRRDPLREARAQNIAARFGQER